MGFAGRDLDIAYPRIEAPADDRLDDMANDEHDAVFQHGLRIAEEIRGQMHAHGRRRHFDESAWTKNTYKSVALHHLAGIAGPQRDRHAARQATHELNFLKGEKRRNDRETHIGSG